MSSYQIVYKKEAIKFIESNKQIGLRFIQAFTEIAADKNTIKKYDIKKFFHNDYDDIFRIRIGKFRAIFRLIETKLVILVFDIDSRGRIYKKS